MEGLLMLPRTIDKLRAKLPGGKIGSYTIRGSSPLLPGFSLVLLDGIGVTDDRLLKIVENAAVEKEIAHLLYSECDFQPGCEIVVEDNVTADCRIDRAANEGPERHISDRSLPVALRRQ
jgi:hypothetical protein